MLALSKMSFFSVRDAQIEDAPAIARVHVDTWRSAYRGIVPDDHLDAMSYERSAQRREARMQQPAARTLAELQAQLDAFRAAYDEERPHRALGRWTPGEAYRASPKAHPAGRGAAGHLRLRYDLVDKGGRITLRRAGRLHHLGIGAAHRGRRVLAIVDEREVTAVDLGTGEVLSIHLIEPERSYWRNQRRDPGRWPGPRAT